MLDLDQKRDERVDAARREGRGVPEPVVFGGREIAVLPVELPVDVLAPLTRIDQEISLLLSKALAMAQAAAGGDGPLDRAQAMDAVGFLVDLLTTRPDLPTQVIDVLRDIGERLLGVEGLKLFVGQRPTREDYAALVKGVLSHYGVTLGEALRSSDSSTPGGPTLKQTSPTTTRSTPGKSGTSPARRRSSASAA